MDATRLRGMGGTGGLAALALVVAAAGCGGDGGVQLDGGVPYLRDEAGRVVVYRGVNFTGEAKAPPDFTVALADEDLDRMAGWGVTLVRFLVFWEAIEPTAGAYDEA